MNRCKGVELKTQRGISLVGLLVGLLISMLCVLALLTLYRNLVQASTTAQVDTLFDGKMATTVLAIQKATHKAGYGIPNAGADSIVANDTGSELQLLWRFDDGGVQCRGIEEKTVAVGTAPNTVDYRQIYLVTATTGCDTSSSLTAADWGEPTPRVVLGQWRMTDDLTTYFADEHPYLLQFAFANAACTPFGAVDRDNLSEHRVLTVAAANSAIVHEPSRMRLNTYSYCLSNIATASP